MSSEWRTIGFEYPDDKTAGEVFDRANEQLRDCSVWRTATPELDRWFILAVLGRDCDDAGFDWVGEPFEVSEDQRRWMIERRLVRGMTAVLLEEGSVNETRHYTPENAPHAPGQ